MNTTTNPQSFEAALTFADLDLRPELLKVLTELGYEEPTPIQREAIPALVTGTDLLGQAATGTGKTAAFALPILDQLTTQRRDKQPTALILVPTRELAVQVSEAIHKYGREIGARVLAIYGGQPIGRQLQALNRGVDVVVATPGRAVDHINRGTLVLDQLKTVVLDEADEMLDMGFADELDSILAETPAERQTVLFSATMPKRIDSIAQRHLKDPLRIRIQSQAPTQGETPRVRQAAYIVSRAHKHAAIGRVLDAESPKAAIVFCRTRDQVDDLTNTLNSRGYRSEALHGGMNQEQRDRVMNKLRDENVDLIVATDVAARGLDIDHLTHVINYDVPSAPESYVHRIGRVGRAGREGVAITMVEPREHYMLKTIERVTKQRISVEQLPTIADIRARRLDMSTATLREVLLENDFEDFRVVVESLSDEFDIFDVALAAVKVAHDASGSIEDEADIPVIDLRDKPGRDRDKGRKGSSGPRNEQMARLYVNAGRGMGLRPKDLVGAIANEAGIRGKDIGGIEIADRFSLVEVPAKSAEGVIRALRNTTIKGKKVTVRRDKH